ncbi:MAG: cation:proton antiporter [Thermoplasmata archaeon]|nr:cation:proton antiporter [Thermoplasmata archaeon]
MLNTTEFLVGLFILLSAAVLVGELMTRLGQAALVGQLLVGIIFGPTLLGQYVGLATTNDAIAGIQFLATFFILVMAGLEVSPEEIWHTGFASGLLGLAVFLGPFLLGAVLVPFIYPGLPFLTSLFIALTLSITALPVMGVMLSEFRMGKTQMGVLLMNTAVINELVAVTVFAILLRLYSSGGGQDAVATGIAVGSVALFVTTVLAVHMGLRWLRESRIWYSIQRSFRSTWKSKEVGFAVLMIMSLGAALYSQYLGLTFLVGAFYAGLLITPESAGRREHRSIEQVFGAMTWGFFIPLFFAFVGLQMNLRLLLTTPWTLAAFGILVTFAILSKFLVGAFVGRFLGWEARDARTIGFLVSSRGAVELAMAVVLLQNGVFTPQLYTIVAGVGLVTTALAPIFAVTWGRVPTGRGPAVAPRWLAGVVEAGHPVGEKSPKIA